MTNSAKSLAELLASAPEQTRVDLITGLSPAARKKLLYHWPFWARPKQLEPTGTWTTWLVLAGRGFGKTRTGAEWIRQRVEAGARWVGMAGRTAGDVRDTMMEGPAGLLSVFPRRQRPLYEPSKRRVTFHTGAIGILRSADEPDQFRGPQYDCAWADEIASWQYEESWDQMMFGLRLGTNPRVVVTTTPRPTPLIKSLIKDPNTVLTRGSTFENKGNLAAPFLQKLVAKYEGTRLGRQELYAEVLTDTPGALWTYAQVEALRLRAVPVPLKRIVVAIDPAVTAGEDSDETGLMVVGLGEDSHLYILEDLSGRHTPNEWARLAVGAYRRFQADRIVGEVNNGGDLVEVNIRTVDPNISYKAVHAAKGKRTRAEPVGALYEQRKVHHVGSFSVLEDQMCTWIPGQGRSPDRVDALVWAVTELGLKGEPGTDWW